MPIELKDTDKGLGVLITGSGIVTANEYINNFTRHLTQNRDKFRSYRYSLDDWTAVNKVEVPTEAITHIAQLCNEAQKINPDVVVAHVADKNITFGLSRMLETFPCLSLRLSLDKICGGGPQRPSNRTGQKISMGFLHGMAVHLIRR